MAKVPKPEWQLLDRQPTARRCFLRDTQTQICEVQGQSRDSTEPPIPTWWTGLRSELVGVKPPAVAYGRLGKASLPFEITVMLHVGLRVP